MLGALLFGSLVFVLIASRRADEARLRLVAHNARMLRRLCRATRRILRSVSTVEHLAIDLTLVPDMDLSTLALLADACRRWTDAGAHVVVEGCTGQVAQIDPQPWSRRGRSMRTAG